MYLTETHVQVRELARHFANEVIRPVDEALDYDESLSADIFRQMGDPGLLGICLPKEMGSPGFGTHTCSLVMEELSRGYASIADQCGLVERISTLLLRYRAQPTHDHDGWAFRGGKIWIGTVRVADLGFVLALADRETGNGGMSIFIGDLHSDGLERGPKKQKMGQRAVLAFRIVNAGLEVGVDHDRQRRQFKKPIAEFQSVQCPLADMAVAYTADAVKDFGGAHYIRGFEVERLYRDAKNMQIYEGTDQIRRIFITRELLSHGAAA